MNKTLPPLINLVLVSLLLVGCSGSVQKYRYYVLQPLASGLDSNTNGSVGINPVIIPDWMDRQSLIWSDGLFRLYKSDLDRWGEPLSRAITRVTAENLNRLTNGTFITTGPWSQSQRPEHTVDIDVLSVAKESQRMVLDVRWVIKHKNKVQAIGHKQFASSLAGLGTADEMVEVFSQLLLDMAEEIRQQL
ncbi:PqiC family protein [Endozoicomonas sp. Mp262]|uniref:PqiC family protein n=1 Tax=Endozoicomonas sp. Mp262 TaxID=2919499 RepID=UPI0021D90E88